MPSKLFFCHRKTSHLLKSMQRVKIARNIQCAYSVAVSIQFNTMIKLLQTHGKTYCFPFGRPEGALKGTLSLLERVLMKDVVTPVPPEEVRGVIKKCLENAALVNYTRICNEARLEERMAEEVSPQQRMEDMLRVAELCVDLLKENEEQHGEAFAWFSDLLTEHAEIFWSLFAVDLDAALATQTPDTWDAFPVFQLLNDYLCSEQQFAPMVVRYVDLMEHSISQSIEKGFAKEKWEPRGSGCATSEDIFWKLEALQGFVSDLHWPDEEFGSHLELRMKGMAGDMIGKVTNSTIQCFEQWLSRAKKSTDYVLPCEICVMINVIFDSKAHSSKLCSTESGEKSHAKLIEMLDKTLKQMDASVVEKLLGVLEGSLAKLARYDEGNPVGKILSFAPKPNNLFNKQKFNKLVSSSHDEGKAVEHLPGNRDSLRSTGSTGSANRRDRPNSVTSTGSAEYFGDYANPGNSASSQESAGNEENHLSPSVKAATKGATVQAKSGGHLGQEYVSFMRACTEQLRQVVIDELYVNTLFEKVYSDFELHGIDEEKLNNKSYQSVCRRIQCEETNASLSASTNTGSGAASAASDALSSVGNIAGSAKGKMFSLFNGPGK